jgi:hypothetical protein
MVTRGDQTPNADRPPMAMLVDMISGNWLARAVHVVAELGIADLLGGTEANWRTSQSHGRSRWVRQPPGTE